MASAKAIAASLPDWTTIPRKISSTVTRELTSMNIFEPPLRHAFSLTVTVSSRRRVSSFNARKARKAVIILVIEAGGVRRSASFSKSTAPVSKSIKIASRAGVSSAVAGRAMAIARPKKQDTPSTTQGPFFIFFFKQRHRYPSFQAYLKIQNLDSRGTNFQSAAKPSAHARPKLWRKFVGRGYRLGQLNSGSRRPVSQRQDGRPDSQSRSPAPILDRRCQHRSTVRCGPDRNACR